MGRHWVVAVAAVSWASVFGLACSGTFVAVESDSRGASDAALSDDADPVDAPDASDDGGGRGEDAAVTGDADANSRADVGVDGANDARSSDASDASAMDASSDVFVRDASDAAETSAPDAGDSGDATVDASDAGGDAGDDAAADAAVEAGNDAGDAGAARKHKFVFVTSRSFTGQELGGLFGADRICETAAGRAGLPGTYRAWLSDRFSAPQTRFNPLIITVDVPYVLVQQAPGGVEAGPKISDDGLRLTTASFLLHAIDRDENGTHSFASFAWTNTTFPGVRDSATDHCGSWLSTNGNGSVGNPQTTTSGWSRTATKNCSSRWPIYCFEQ